MKLLTIFIFFTVLSVGYSQDFEIPALEFYTLEEAKKELIEQGEHYWCQTPTYLICQLLPRFRNYDYRVSELENLTPYRHLVDFEEIEATLNPYILRGSVLEIFQYNPFIGATLEQKEEFLQTHFPDTTWQEYLDDRFSNIYSYQKRRVLSAYSDGFLLIS